MNLQYRKAGTDEAEKVCHVVQHTKTIIITECSLQQNNREATASLKKLRMRNKRFAVVHNCVAGVA